MRKKILIKKLDKYIQKKCEERYTNMIGAIAKIVETNPDVYFLFKNLKVMNADDHSSPNVDSLQRIFWNRDADGIERIFPDVYTKILETFYKEELDNWLKNVDNLQNEIDDLRFDIENNQSL